MPHVPVKVVNNAQCCSFAIFGYVGLVSLYVLLVTPLSHIYWAIRGLLHQVSKSLVCHLCLVSEANRLHGLGCNTIAVFPVASFEYGVWMEFFRLHHRIA